MKHHETSWNIMKHHETSWNIMKHHETSWNIMKPWVQLRVVPRCSDCTDIIISQVFPSRFWNLISTQIVWSQRPKMTQRWFMLAWTTTRSFAWWSGYWVKAWEVWWSLTAGRLSRKNRSCGRSIGHWWVRRLSNDFPSFSRASIGPGRWLQHEAGRSELGCEGGQWWDDSPWCHIGSRLYYRYLQVSTK